MVLRFFMKSVLLDEAIFLLPFFLLYARFYTVLHLLLECRFKPVQKVVDLRDELSVTFLSGAVKRQRGKRVSFMQILVSIKLFQTFAVLISLSVNSCIQDEGTVPEMSSFTD